MVTKIMDDTDKTPPVTSPTMSEKFACPKMCSRVIDEYTHTRMEYYYKKCEEATNSTPITESSDDGNSSPSIDFDTNLEISIESSLESIKTERPDDDFDGNSDLVVTMRNLDFPECLIDRLDVDRDSGLSGSMGLGDVKRRSQSDSLIHKVSGKESESKTCGDKVINIITELITTEKAYVESLRFVVEDYIPELSRHDLIPALRGQKFNIFGNIEKIYEFHRGEFLKDLEKCLENPAYVGQCFLKCEEKFYIYSMYNKNKTKSDEIMKDYGYYFEDKRKELGHDLNLSSQLLKPVQRLARYSLFLQKILEELDATFGTEALLSILKARDMVVFQLRHGNDLIVMDGIKNCDVNLNEQGKLLRQDEFILLEPTGKRPKKRIFLFQNLILFSSPSKTDSMEYIYNRSMKMEDIGLTDWGDLMKFTIWFRKYNLDKFTLEAYSPEVKTAWVKEIRGILLQQAEEYKLKHQKTLAELGITSQTRIPIQRVDDEDEDGEDQVDSNASRNHQKVFTSMRSLRGVPGEINPKKPLERSTWYCMSTPEEKGEYI